ncbi:MAG: DUF4160 domain-containing protein [Sphaerochaetaceae bacterium]|jgi:hypothetical protein|nr:DUF4160 domain-containing protein [Sphaerochaetaceae bacterium]MDD3163930.1 DUF4160 domain-containing protein [Sphaerochaetaceae bacterium]
MPEIARFYGIIIKMYFNGNEHNPPHFHVIYGEYAGIMDIDTLELTEGDIPKRAISMVKEWAGNHKAELMNMWNTQHIKKIQPLK